MTKAEKLSTEFDSGFRVALADINRGMSLAYLRAETTYTEWGKGYRKAVAQAIEKGKVR